MMPVLYSYAPSPPCRAVLMTAKTLGVELELKVVNVLEGEQRAEDFLEVNPRHTIPTLDDDGFILTESRSIMCYLVDKFGSEDDKLYPKDVQQRHRVLERLLFDQDCLYRRLSEYYTFSALLSGSELDEAKLPPLKEAFKILNKYLESSDWAAGADMTIADISLAVTVSQAELYGFDLDPYPNVARWLESCKSDIAGYQDINEEGLSIFKSFISA